MSMDSPGPGETGRALARIERMLEAMREDMKGYVLEKVHEAEMQGVRQDLADERAALERQSASVGVWVRWALALALSSFLTVVGMAVAFFGGGYAN